jgi:hypothetical protein
MWGTPARTTTALEIGERSKKPDITMSSKKSSKDTHTRISIEVSQGDRDEER